MAAAASPKDFSTCLHEPSFSSSHDGDDVFLSRHGARIDLENPRWLDRAGHGRADDPHLSSKGRVGAAELARRMRDLSERRGWTLSHVVSSPYVRCVETATAVAEALDLTVKVEPGIAEVNSSRSQGFLDAIDLRASFSLVDDAYVPVVTKADLGIERSDGVAARRAADAARRVRERLNGRILFVGHGASCLGIAGEFGRGGYVGYTSLTRFVRDEGDDDGPRGGGRWKLDGTFGDVSHLSDQQTSLDSAW